MELVIVGGGLAGCEAAWQAAQRGVKVVLYEMRPLVNTGAHTTPFLGELVCSNSLGSNRREKASGLLKHELRRLGSLLIDCADHTAVPAGEALAVDRVLFAQMITSRIENHPNITVVREEITEIPDQPTIIASGPLTSHSLSLAIQSLTGHKHLYFYDAIAPIVSYESINLAKVYRASRYDTEGEKEDYINCPLTKHEYDAFVDALLSAERIELKEFEKDLEDGITAGVHQFFEACLPIEILARRGREALAYGPMRPVGLETSQFSVKPYAVVQLRQDNLAGTLYNMVGFQTNLKFHEQERVFRLIPGLEHAEFVRYGQMHRNTFIFSPALLLPTLQYHDRDDLFFAGQITGVEGYAGNIATGLLAGINAARLLRGKEPITMPPETMIGALCHYITHASPSDFQPMKANFGILPPLNYPRRMGKKQRIWAYVERSNGALEKLIESLGEEF
jgi:methylenetetrahydrofolate--tRNA-(uracil-5-)-methyltransferase